MSAIGAPVPEGGFTVYDSYAIDPLYAHYLTYAALAALASATLITLPSLWRSILTQTFFHRLSLFGLRYRPNAFRPLPDTEASSPTAHKPPNSLLHLHALATKLFLRTPTLKLFGFRFVSRLTLLNIFLILLIPTIVLSTLLPASQLSENANRAGFLALASLPWIFLLGGKSTGLASLTSLGYERLNYLHRWLGRAVLGLVLLHFGLWTSQFAAYGSSYTATRLKGTKESRGIMSLCFLLLLALPSVGWVRRQPIFGWRIFKTLHVVGFVGLIIGVNMHTIYAWPWTVGVMVVYAVDVACRVFRYRFKQVQIEALPGGITRLRIEGATYGWRAGQHVRLRLFFPTTPSRFSLWRIARPLESHPLSISHAPEGASVAGADGCLVLFCRAGQEGGWAADLWASAAARRGRVVSGLVDGPYGGLPVHASVYDRSHLLLLAGGSGMSFVMGVLDEAVSAAVWPAKGCALQTISVVWCVREEAMIGSYMPTLDTILSAARTSRRVSIRLTIYVSGASEEATSLVEEKPDVRICMKKRCDIKQEIDEWIQPDEKADRPSDRGGRTIVVCGPLGMIAETRNSVASLALSTIVGVGGVKVYSEHFGL